MTTPTNQFVRLLDPLPCASPQGDGVCGQPAYVATTWPIDSLHTFVFRTGTWATAPVCATCATALAARYADGDQAAQNALEAAAQHNLAMRRGSTRFTSVRSQAPFRQRRHTMHPRITHVNLTADTALGLVADTEDIVITQYNGQAVQRILITRAQLPRFLESLLTLCGQWRNGATTVPGLAVSGSAAGLTIDDDEGSQILVANTNLNAFLDALLALAVNNEEAAA